MSRIFTIYACRHSVCLFCLLFDYIALSPSYVYIPLYSQCPLEFLDGFLNILYARVDNYNILYNNKKTRAYAYTYDCVAYCLSILSTAMCVYVCTYASIYGCMYVCMYTCVTWCVYVLVCWLRACVHPMRLGMRKICVCIRMSLYYNVKRVCLYIIEFRVIECIRIVRRMRESSARLVK